MKEISLLFAILISLAFRVNAQNDYSHYLDKAWECLKSDNCDAAQRNYSVYKDLTGEKNISLEEALSECTNNSNESSYKIGDDATELVRERDYKIAYLNAKGNHGFAIQIGPYSRLAPNRHARNSGTLNDRYAHTPSIDELQKMYPNRDKLDLNEEYWSRTGVPGSRNVYKYFTKFYTFDFKSGSTYQRRDPVNEKQGKYNLRTMKIICF